MPCKSRIISVSPTLLPIVLNECVSGAGVHVRCQSGHTAAHIDTEGHMEVLLDSSLNINHLSQEVLVDWPFILEVSYVIK